MVARSICFFLIDQLIDMNAEQRGICSPVPMLKPSRSFHQAVIHQHQRNTA